MKKLLCVLLLLPLFITSCFALDVVEETARQTKADRVEEELSPEEREISGELSLDGSYDAGGALGRLWKRLLESLKNALQKELGFAEKLIALAVCCGLCTAFYPGGKPPPWMEIGVCCAAVLLLSGSVGGVFREANNTLDHLHDYARAAFPAFFSTLAACGAPSSASVRYASIVFASDLFMNLARQLILPLIEAHLSLSICASLFDNPMLRTAVKGSKWCAVTAITSACSLFCVYVGLTGVITGSADAAAVKAAKTVFSSALPVVGGILSNSASSILAAAALIKNSAGVFCLIAVCAICVVPFALLFLKFLVFKAAASLSALGGSEHYTSLLNSVGTVFGML